MCVHHLRYVMAVSYEKTEHFLKSLIAHWCGLHLGLYVSLPPERTLARRSKALYNDQKKITRPDHSVWNHCHTLLQAGLLDMTTLNSYQCVKSLLEVLLICSEKKSSLKTEGEVSSGSYLDVIGIGESGFSSILGMSNISLFIFLFPCIHYNGWMIWGFLVFEWSYCSIPTHDKRLWNAVHLANSQWFQTFQTQSVEQISLLPVISEKHRRQVGHVSVAFYVTVWQLKMHQGASFPSICAVIPTVLLIMFLLPQ